MNGLLLLLSSFVYIDWSMTEVNLKSHTHTQKSMKKIYNETVRVHFSNTSARLCGNLVVVKFSDNSNVLVMKLAFLFANFLN